MQIILETYRGIQDFSENPLELEIPRVSAPFEEFPEQKPL